VKKVLAALIIALFSFSMVVTSVGCSGDSKKDSKKDK